MEGELHFLDQFASVIVEAVDFAALAEVPHAAAIWRRRKTGYQSRAYSALGAIAAFRFRKSPVAEDPERLGIP